MSSISVEKKQKPKNLVSFLLVSSFYTAIGIIVFGFIYISSKSNQDIEHYQKYTKKIIAEIERHELLKHQIAQGTIVIEKDKKVEDKKKSEIKCEKNDKNNVKNKSCEENKKGIQNEDKESNEITSTNIFRNDEIIKLDNAIIKNDTYSIVTTFDFTNSDHLFSTPAQLCHLVKYLAPEIKDSLFTTVKFGDFIIRKNSKAMNDNQTLVFKDCKNQATKIIIETKFYPKDLTTSPTQTQLSVAGAPNPVTLTPNSTESKK